MPDQPYTTIEHARVMPLAAALEQYEMPGLYTGMLNGLKGDFYIFDADAHFSAMDLDQLFYQKDACGAYFRGNLTVDTFIIQPEIDYGPFVYVHGSVTAKNIFLGGGYIHFRGDVNVEQTLVGGTYNHGMSCINGAITAEVIISNDHGFDYRAGNVKKGFIFINNQSENIPPHDPADVLNKGYWDKTEEAVNTGNILKAVKEGKSILKADSGTSPVTKRLEKAIASKAKRADLSKLKLKSLPAELFQVTDLKQLKLSANPLTTFGEELAALSALNTLELSDCELTEAPAVISQLSALETLDLSNNGITSLPASFSSLQQLKKILLNGCYLKEVPAVLKDLPNLEVLDLEYQREDALLSIDGGFNALKELHLWGDLNAPLPRLERLHLRRRAMQQLPEALRGCKKLKAIDITPSVVLQELPAWLPELQHLEEVALYLNNNIKNLEVLSGLPKLKTLRIEYDRNKPPKHIYELPKIPSWSVLYIRSFEDNSLMKQLLERPNLTKLVLTDPGYDNVIDLAEGRRWLGITI